MALDVLAISVGIGVARLPFDKSLRLGVAFAGSEIETAESSFVERVRQGKVERVPIDRGSTMGDTIEVFGALKPGNLVLVRGSEELGNGAEVLPRVQRSSGG